MEGRTKFWLIGFSIGQERHSELFMIISQSPLRVVHRHNFDPVRRGWLLQTTLQMNPVRRGPSFDSLTTCSQSGELEGSTCSREPPIATNSVPLQTIVEERSSQVLTEGIATSLSVFFWDSNLSTRPLRNSKRKKKDMKHMYEEMAIFPEFG